MRYLLPYICIKKRSHNIQPPNLSFYNLGIAPKMLSILEKMNFVSPTPIQHKAIPQILEGKDLVGIAQTGTGKTLAFGIPMIQQLVSNGGTVVILAPTRELAMQINEVLRDILRQHNMKSVVLIGGANINTQIKRIRERPQVIIATPGRMIDHIQQRTLKLDNVNILVLDEADRMFDMGFQPQVEQIIRHIPRQRQTLLFSATMPGDIVKLTTKHMKLPIRIEIAPSGTAAEQISHELFIVKENSKRRLLSLLLKEYRGSILLFVRTKIKAKRITKMVRELRYKAAEIHSNRTMSQRKIAMEGFKSGQYRILIATDIAARGIDVSDIELVINYDLPDDIENFVHRIGRTGRAGVEGHAIAFATPEQGDVVQKIEKFMKKSLPITTRSDMDSEKFVKSNIVKNTSRNRNSKRYGNKRRTFQDKTQGGKSISRNKRPKR